MSDATHPVRLDSTQNLTPAATRKDNGERGLVLFLLYVYVCVRFKWEGVVHVRLKDLSGGFCAARGDFA